MSVTWVLTHSSSNKVPYSKNVLVRGATEQAASSTQRKLPSLCSWCRYTPSNANHSTERRLDSQVQAVYMHLCTHTRTHARSYTFILCVMAMI